MSKTILYVRMDLSIAYMIQNSCCQTIQFALKEHDERQLYVSRRNLLDLRNIYAVISDILHKNIAKVYFMRLKSCAAQLNTLNIYLAPYPERQQSRGSLLNGHGSFCLICRLAVL